jgi:hypothetical protein
MGYTLAAEAPADRISVAGLAEKVMEYLTK